MTAGANNVYTLSKSIIGKATGIKLIATKDVARTKYKVSFSNLLDTKNIQAVREIQREIHDYYGADASKYDEENKLKIRRIYDQIPSNLENKKKRVVAQRIEGKKGSTFANYEDEFEYLISAGIALNV